MAWRVFFYNYYAENYSYHHSKYRPSIKHLCLDYNFSFII